MTLPETPSRLLGRTGEQVPRLLLSVEHSFSSSLLLSPTPGTSSPESHALCLGENLGMVGSFPAKCAFSPVTFGYWLCRGRVTAKHREQPDRPWTHLEVTSLPKREAALRLPPESVLRPWTPAPCPTLRVGSLPSLPALLLAVHNGVLWGRSDSVPGNVSSRGVCSCEPVWPWPCRSFQTSLCLYSPSFRVPS